MTKEITINGQKFKIKRLSLKDMIKVWQLTISLGLLNANDETIKQLSISTLPKLSLEIMNLTRETRIAAQTKKEYILITG